MDLRVSLEENDKNIAYFTKMISVTNILLAILLVGAVLFLLNKIVSAPLQKLISVIRSLSHGNRDLTKRVEVHSDDEVGKIAEEFNHYLHGIEENQKEERTFISKAQETIERAKNGCFSTTIDAEVPSETLSDFKNSVNDMLRVTMENFNHINIVLTEYANHNYTKDIKLQNVESGSELHVLIVHINKLKSVITDMLVENRKTNLKLYDFSDVLLKNVESLNTGTQETQLALQDVNNSMELITGNIHNNNRNVTVMSDLANNVTTSARDGEALTDKTTIAMEEINEQVNAINEAITVIDQIAFQTNILSLNAAVEAATAGEAGKGFAVVASEVRNLATKSAEAAKKIQELVENASNMADEGKKIASHMREGYSLLNRNISDTVRHINEIKEASNEQLQAITLINERINKVTRFTRENSHITKKTKEIALKTDEMAKYAVKKIDEKEFDDK
jgi:methyl-accepting chemotaxis protein